MAYQPQSDGMMECFNQEIEAYIRIYCSSNPETWHKSISTMEFTHNSRWHSDRQWTSFKLMMGTSPLTIPTTFEHTKFPSVDEQIQQLTKDWEEAIAAHKLAWWRMAEQYKNKFTGFKLDQLVWLDTWNLKTKYHKKMTPKCKGPFRISKVLRPVTYWLELPPTWQIHCFPCSAPHALHWKWSSQTKLPPTTTRHQKWWRMIGNQGYTQSPTMRMRIPILHLMERMADH